MLAVPADDSTEYQASARCAMVAHSISATQGFRDRVSRFATDAQRARWEGEKWDETRPRRFAAISAETIALVRGVAPRFIPNRATQTPADINLRVNSCAKVTPRSSPYIRKKHDQSTILHEPPKLGLLAIAPNESHRHSGRRQQSR